MRLFLKEAFLKASYTYMLEKKLLLWIKKELFHDLK